MTSQVFVWVYLGFVAGEWKKTGFTNSKTLKNKKSFWYSHCLNTFSKILDIIFTANVSITFLLQQNRIRRNVWRWRLLVPQVCMTMFFSCGICIKKLFSIVNFAMLSSLVEIEPIVWTGTKKSRTNWFFTIMIGPWYYHMRTKFLK